MELRAKDGACRCDFSYFAQYFGMHICTGAKTGRSPNDKRIMRDPESESEVWWGPRSPNFEMDEKAFLINRERAIDYLNTLERVYVTDGYINWDPNYRFKVRANLFDFVPLASAPPPGPQKAGGWQ